MRGRTTPPEFLTEQSMMPVWGTVVLPARLVQALPDVPVEISADVIAFDAATAVRESAERLEPLYWVDLDVDRRWYVIGRSGQGDEWLVGPDGGVSFFDHNHGERSVHLFERLHISVTDWLVIGHALGRFEAIDEPSDVHTARLLGVFEAVDADLAERWPYPIGAVGG